MIRKFSEAEIAGLRKKFNSAKPFEHAIIENFFVNYQAIVRDLKKEKFIAKDTDLFSFKQTNNLAYAKTKGAKEAVSDFSSKEFSELIGKITGMKLKKGAVDLFGALYQKTDYLLCHDDELEGRKIAFIVYLSQSFEKKDGGSLVLMESKGTHPTKKVIAYPPLRNSLAMFKVSRKSWHEVEEVLSSKKRYSIGGWLH